jgi:hypothetical protein
VTGTSTLPAITRSQTVELIVKLTKPDFIITASPNLLILNQSTCGNVTVTIKAIGSFNSPVNVRVSGLPEHVTYEVIPNPVTPPVGGTVTTIVQICAESNAVPGNYTYTLTGTGTANGTAIVHTLSLLLRINKPSAPPLNFLLLLLILLMLLLAILLGLLAWYLSRKRRPVPRAMVAVPVARPRPAVRYVLPLPTVRCRHCGRLIPLHAIYCPYCGRPQVILAPPPPRVVAPGHAARGGILGFALSLVAGILVLLNAVAFLSPTFWAMWAGIFWWLPSLGQSYAFVLGVIIGLVMIFAAVMMIVKHGVLADIIIFPFAIFSLIIGGGFVAGMVLGIIGGIFCALNR